MGQQQQQLVERPAHAEAAHLPAVEVVGRGNGGKAGVSAVGAARAKEDASCVEPATLLLPPSLCNTIRPALGRQEGRRECSTAASEGKRPWGGHPTTGGSEKVNGGWVHSFKQLIDVFLVSKLSLPFVCYEAANFKH